MLCMTAGPRTARRRRVTYPVENLRVQVSALETAVAQVLAKPRKEAVHELRSVTRKIEAHLTVLAELGRQQPGFQVMEHPSRRVKKLLGVVRRAAGRVRDLDVLQRLAVECIKEGATEQLESEVKEIRMQLKKERDTAAAELMKVLAARGIELEPMLEALIHALLPVETVGMSAVEQEVMTRSWYAAQLAEARKMSKPDEAMHHIRKAAKLARYMAEGGLAKRVVDEFRKLQEAGGRWHDCVCLRDVTLERLGKRSGLAALLKERETAARSSFEALLSD